ncbi:MAG: VWA domain-containing protein [Muribaculaceae bacterium]|nr:VWA domain-containing protein [Muribaculaceae bacterium]
MSSFQNPSLLWLFVIYAPLIAWYIFRQRKAQPTILISSTSAFSQLGTSWKVFLKHFSFALKLLALGCLIIILARPQTHDSWSKSETEGTDIVVVLDISTSMLAKDFSPNRLDAAKDVATQFVSGRETDNIGFVIFAGEAFTQIPMTTDRATLINAIHDVEIGALEDGTAIGDGIATSINRIKDGKAKSKSIILLTDGSNNTGVVAPLTAAQIAQKYGIKIYTIGVGTNGTALYPVAMDYNGRIQYERLPVVIDEATLKKIASTTGGKYFRATNKGVLKQVFGEIDQLEKTRMDVRNFSHTEDNYMPWAWLLLVLLLMDAVINHVVLRRIP